MLQLDTHHVTPLHKEFMSHERLLPFHRFVSRQKFSQINVLVLVCCKVTIHRLFKILYTAFQNTIALTFQNIFCLDVDTKAAMEVSESMSKET
jgi:hypothetical protein